MLIAQRAGDHAPTDEASRQGHRPRQLRVAALGLDVPVRALVACGGVLTPPSDPAQVGWWQDGAAPGAHHGRVLITGHGGGLDQLSRLDPNDAIALFAGQAWLSYRVIRVICLTAARLAVRSPRLFATSGHERLVLVTCAGGEGAAYAGSTVVVAEPIEG